MILPPFIKILYLKLTFPEARYKTADSLCLPSLKQLTHLTGLFISFSDFSISSIFVVTPAKSTDLVGCHPFAPESIYSP